MAIYIRWRMECNADVSVPRKLEVKKILNWPVHSTFIPTCAQPHEKATYYNLFVGASKQNVIRLKTSQISLPDISLGIGMLYGLIRAFVSPFEKSLIRDALVFIIIFFVLLHHLQ